MSCFVLMFVEWLIDFSVIFIRVDVFHMFMPLALYDTCHYHMMLVSSNSCLGLLQTALAWGKSSFMWLYMSYATWHSGIRPHNAVANKIRYRLKQYWLLSRTSIIKTLILIIMSSNKSISPVTKSSINSLIPTVKSIIHYAGGFVYVCLFYFHFILYLFILFYIYIYLFIYLFI